MRSSQWIGLGAGSWGALLTVSLLAACGGCGVRGEIPTGSDPPVSNQEAELELVALELEFDDPVHLAAPAGDPRLFIVEQPGRIRVVRDGVSAARPFLDITDRVASGGERGLLSVAFHPDFTTNGRFFVNYTDLNGDTRIERFVADPGSDVADPSSGTLVLEVEQPYGNHNGGHLLFGPDGMLYVALGDGGAAGDPESNGQDRTTLLGALLRLDVDGADPYAVPADNPWPDHETFRPEIWAWGLRNPWRIAFDAEAGLLYVADVGQNSREEINVVRADAGGVNYGWNVLEGSACYASGGCESEGMTLPAVEYDHSNGCSVTGGEPYRGAALPALRGHYFYSDYCQGWLRSFRFEAGAVIDHRVWDVGDLGSVVSFGRDGAGELYVVSRSGIFRFEPPE